MNVVSSLFYRLFFPLLLLLGARQDRPPVDRHDVEATSVAVVAPVTSTDPLEAERRR
jgi:hypothetical protein